MSNIEIIGLDRVLGRLEDIAKAEGVEQGLQKSCAIVERSAKEHAPKDTGALRRSITSKVEGTTGEVFTALEYAPYVEFGTGLFAEKGGRKDVPWGYKDDEGNFHLTSGQRPHPYMRPALKENRDKIIKIIKEGMVKK